MNMHNPALAAQLAAVKAARARMGMNRYSPRVFIPAPQPVEELPPEPEISDPLGKAKSVVRATCIYYGMTSDMLMSSRRALVIVRPRHVAMYVCVKFTPLSLPKIGMVFERDHATVLNASRRIQSLIDCGDAKVIEAVNAIVKKLGLSDEQK